MGRRWVVLERWMDWSNGDRRLSNKSREEGKEMNISVLRNSKTPQVNS